MLSDGNHINSTIPFLDMSASTVLGFALFCTMAVVGTLANLYLINAIYRRQPWRRAPTYVALLCLSVVDAVHLVYLICAGILHISGSGNTNTLCQLLNFGMYSTTGTSSYHMVIFSVLRYVILVKPFFAMKYVTVKNTLCCCLMCWLVFTCFAGLAFFTTELGEIETSDGKTIYACVTTRSGKYVDIAIVIFEYFIPLAIISGFHVAKCVQLRIHSMETANTPTQKQQVSTAILVTIISLYVICYVPLGIYSTIIQVLEIPVAHNVYTLSYVFITLTPLNSALNPFVYFLFTKCFCKKKRPEVGTSLSSQTNTYSLSSFDTDIKRTFGTVLPSSINVA